MVDGLTLHGPARQGAQASHLSSSHLVVNGRRIQRAWQLASAIENGICGRLSGSSPPEVAVDDGEQCAENVYWAHL